MAKRRRTGTLPRPRAHNGVSNSVAHTRAPYRPVPIAPAPVAVEPPSPIRWVQRDWLIVLGLVLFSLVFYFWRLDAVKGFYFDEVYHAFTASELAKGNADAYLWDKTPPPGVAYEWTHPALSKLLMQASIKVFGDNEIGWRGGLAIFGALGIGLMYAMGRVMFNRGVGLFAAALLLMDGLWYTQSRIGMNDVFLATFIMAGYLAFFLYLRGPAPRSRRYLWLTGAMLGAALATKWSAAYSFPLLGGIAALRELWLLVRGWRTDPAMLETTMLPRIGGRAAWRIRVHRLVAIPVTLAGAFVVVPGIIYMLAYSQFFLMGHDFSQWKELQRQMYYYHTGLKATHPWASRWWTWPLMLKPVWYYSNQDAQGNVANIYGMGNPLIWWAFLPAVFYAALEWVDSKFKAMALAVVLLGFLGNWLPWMLSPRISFMYHMLPSVPFGVLAIAFALSKLRAPRIAVAGYLVPVLVAFIYFFPLYSAWPVTRAYNDQHMWIAGWRPR